MESNHLQQPFKQYRLTPYHSLLHSLPPMDDKIRVKALVEGTVLRYGFRLYRGDMEYVQDLQTILNHDRELAPLVLK